MWIFGEQGFLSIVRDRDSQLLIVRARVKGDIEKYFPGYKVIVDAGSDYKYRTTVQPGLVAEVISRAIKHIKYDNFKDTVPDVEVLRYDAYSQIWSIMKNLQKRAS